jgi:hypothetical protein
MFLSPLRGVAAAVLLALAASPALAVPIFDGTGLRENYSTRSAGDSPLAHFTFGQETTIEGFSALLDSGAAGNIKFLIFDEGALAYESASIALANSLGFAEVFSGPMSYTFQTGRSYFVGAIADVGASWAYSLTEVTQNGVTNVRGNANVSNFASPLLGGLAEASIAVSLYGELPGDAVVPLPAAAPLLAFGLAAIGVAARRRRG